MWFAWARTARPASVRPSPRVSVRTCAARGVAVRFANASNIAVTNKLLAEMDVKRDGEVEEEEFLQVSP